MITDYLLEYYATEKMTKAIAKAIDEELEQAREFIQTVYPVYKKRIYTGEDTVAFNTYLASIFERNYGITLPFHDTKEFLYGALLIENICSLIPSEPILKEFLKKYMGVVQPGEEWTLTVDKTNRIIDIVAPRTGGMGAQVGIMDTFLSRILPAGLVVQVHLEFVKWVAISEKKWEDFEDKTWKYILNEGVN